MHFVRRKRFRSDGLTVALGDDNNREISGRKMSSCLGIYRLRNWNSSVLFTTVAFVKDCEPSGSIVTFSMTSLDSEIKV